ncbi:LysR substrate-binding domain-containing protein [Actinomadura rupiterrae]|uniref:LysR substrate-binding domain-containing protein n=1 Tax=Actinomadura rupiterrae TaxID=559627 RepID=UPI0020A5E6FA|nr:LysR substrate-binding domain-containing protein [Actinomadura rupiterrae]MCP2336907.1 DNA-binding transcriptional LysR family regulator [Actinomadura rupiterrae]
MDIVGHLAHFVAVAEELHFGRAAERLGMAQPPLSQRIRRLEDELGVRLFDRTSRRVELTAAGRLLLPEARDVLGRVDRIRELSERARSGEVGLVRAGLPADLGGDVVAALVSAFRDRRPDLRLALRETGTAEQVEALADGSLDVAVLRHPCDTRGLALGPVLAQPLGVLLAADDPLGASGEVRVDALAGRDLVLFPREEAPGAHDDLLAACRRNGFEPHAVHEARHPQFALGLVLLGTAVALVPRLTDWGGAVWRPLAGSPLALRTSCAWRRDAGDGPVADFAAVTTDVLREVAAMRPLDAVPPRRVVLRPSSGFLS